MISKSLFFISCILIIFSTSVKSQFSTGVTIGYSNNQLSTDISNRTFTRNKNYGGFCMELIFGNSLSRLVSFRTGIGFLQKNFSFKRTDKYAGVFETFTNSYIQFPLVGQIKIIEIKRLCVSLSTGFYGAYWAYAKVCGATPNIFDSSYGFDDDGQMVQYLSLTSYSENINLTIQRIIVLNLE